MSSVAHAKAGELRTLHSYPAGTQLYGQDECAVNAYLIRSGVVKLVWTDTNGRETIVGLRWPGDFFGVSALLAERSESAGAVTLVPCRVEGIPGGRLVDEVKNNTGFSMLLHRVQSRIILDQERDLAELACVPARQRLERLLRRLKSSVPDQVCLPDGRMYLPLKKLELAQLLHITPQHLARVMAHLVSDGVITVHHQWIVLH